MSPTRTEGPRLQRYLAEAGVAARRKAEELDLAGGDVPVPPRSAEPSEPPPTARYPREGAVAALGRTGNYGVPDKEPAA